MKIVKFKDLNRGDKFECWGDIHLNYDIPTWCKCVKTEENIGKEIGGVNFLMGGSDEVQVNY